MSDEERAALAALVKAERVRRYRTMKAAYQDAGVNPATWNNVEGGRSAKPEKVAAVVHTLWPSSGGDWRAVVTPTVAAVGPATMREATDIELLKEVGRRLGLTIEEREDHGPESAPTSEAGATPASGVAEISGEGIGDPGPGAQPQTGARRRRARGPHQ